MKDEKERKHSRYREQSIRGTSKNIPACSTNCKEVHFARAERVRCEEQEMRCERKGAELLQGLVRWDFSGEYGRSLWRSWKQTHFSYKGITLHAEPRLELGW